MIGNQTALYIADLVVEPRKHGLYAIFLRDFMVSYAAAGNLQLVTGAVLVGQTSRETPDVCDALDGCRRGECSDAEGYRLAGW